MKILPSILLPCLLGLVACPSGGSNDDPPSSAVQAKTLPDNSEVMAKVYNGLYQVPESFYIDERADTSRSYSLYHVKDISVSYERCSQDYSEALDWETVDNDSRSVSGSFVGSYENDRYYEFIRELAYPDSLGNIEGLTSPGFARVFKCNYVDRDGVDRNLLDGYAGTLNMRPLSIDAIKTYSEYMWQFTFFWPATKTVLETHSAEQLDAYQHTLVLAFLTNQGTDKCDLIDVVDWIFTVDKTDGTIAKEFRLRRQFEAQLINGVPETCGT